MTRRLMEGSEAIADAMVGAGCRFFTGYPMTPFTEVLEHMAKKLPPLGGTCINAESEIEAVGMCWGAAATGTLAATGSVGQGLSLMQESLAEITLAKLPLVVLNMARGQSDYWQATRGGGHGDYRHLVLAPMDVPEAARLVRLAFELTQRWRNPVLVMGDYFLAHVYQGVEVDEPEPPPAPPPWALDGSSGGSGRAKLISPLGDVKQRDDVGYDLQDYYLRRADETRAMLEGVAPLSETGSLDGAEVVVVAYGTPARYVRAAVRELREEGRPVGFIRPVSLVPFPTTVVSTAAESARLVTVFENSTGQMVDDVRLAVLGRCPVEFIGGLTTDTSGFGVGPDLDVAVVRSRIEALAVAAGVWS
ncbi:MAG TPA: hypothetical protein VMB72_03580 [Acidimicrobiales bacterium]|nr:hypothetical protein [Acidimicrobiales bacterium]